MTITIDIRPEVHEKLARQAAQQGTGVEAHVASLLEESIQTSALKPNFDLKLAQAAAARQRGAGEGSLGQALTVGVVDVAR